LRRYPPFVGKIPQSPDSRRCSCFTQLTLSKQDKLMRGRTEYEYTPGHGARSATVIGRWGDDMALLRTDDGATVEAEIPERLRHRIDVGASVTLLDDGLVDWRVPDGPAPDPGG
jgi:hypothetical protein